jgi:hypothetical protein
MTTPLLPFYREIPLTKGQMAIVDPADYQSLIKHKWYANWSLSSKAFYAQATIDGKRGVQMHRLILGLKRSDGMEADHRNGDTLDNRRDNLRIATHAQNQRNKGRQANNTSGYKGVYWHKTDKVWRARIKVAGKDKHLGSFSSKESAYEAYCAAAKQLHGEFACLS